MLNSEMAFVKMLRSKNESKFSRLKLHPAGIGGIGTVCSDLQHLAPHSPLEDYMCVCVSCFNKGTLQGNTTFMHLWDDLRKKALTRLFLAQVVMFPVSLTGA